MLQVLESTVEIRDFMPLLHVSVHGNAPLASGMQQVKQHFSIKCSICSRTRDKLQQFHWGQMRLLSASGPSPATPENAVAHRRCLAWLLQLNLVQMAAIRDICIYWHLGWCSTMLAGTILPFFICGRLPVLQRLKLQGNVYQISLSITMRWAALWLLIGSAQWQRRR